MAAMREVPGAVDIESSDEAAKPQLAVELKRELASDLGVGVAQLAATLRPLLAGQAIGNWRAPDDQYYDVQVRLARADRAQRRGPASACRSPRASSTPTARRRWWRCARSPTIARRRRRAADQPQGAAARGAGDGERVQPAGGRRRRRVASEARAHRRCRPGYRFSMGGSTKDIQETLFYASQALALAVIFIYLILAASSAASCSRWRS